MRILKITLLFFLPFLSFHEGFSQTILIQQDFTNYLGTSATVPAGWNFTYNGDYTSTTYSGNSGPNSYKFGVTGATITTPLFSNADSLQFWMRGSSVDNISFFTILYTVNGTTWDTLKKILPISNSGTTIGFHVPNNAIQLQFTFTKSAGNLAFDDFLLTADTAKTTTTSNNQLSKIQVYFNHPIDSTFSNGVKATYVRNAIMDTIAAYINRAKYTIDVAQYDYSASAGDTLSHIATAINNAYSRGVKIRWIDNGSSSNTGVALLNSSIPVVQSPTTSAYNIMHNKFVLIDVNAADTTLPIVCTGSDDWSQEMNDHDFNNLVFIQSKVLTRAYTNEFNIMWGDTTHGGTPNSTNSKFGPYKPNSGTHIFNIGGSKIELYFSPSDSVNNHILSTIATAGTDIYLAMYTFTESNDASAILNQVTGGAFGAAILDQYSSTYSSYTSLKAGLPTANFVEYTGGYIYHNKYLVVDPSAPCSDPLVLTGSHNWTATADSKNDENTLIIHNDTIANLYLQGFAGDFKTIGGKSLGRVTPPCGVIMTASASTNSNVTCNGKNNGSATVSASGGISPYTYSWSPSGGSLATMSGLSAGTYTATVTDAKGHNAIVTITITQPTTLSISIASQTNVLCNGGTGSAQANTASGGTSPYGYSWAPNGGTSLTSNALTVGTYTITATDANGCVASASVIITQPIALRDSIVSASTVNETCNGGANGSATAGVKYGTAPYTYNWSPGSKTTAKATGLSAGTYTVTVKDNNGCSGSTTVTITQPGAIHDSIVSASIINETCSGGANGSATAGVKYGTAPYNYSWSPSGKTTATANGLSAGTYTVTVKDKNGCSATAKVTITQPNAIRDSIVTASTVNILCNGSSTGSATAGVKYGTSPYTYSWSPSGKTTAKATGLSAGIYTVTVKDKNGCSATAKVTLTQPGDLRDSISSSSCSGSKVKATVGVKGGITPYTYLWSPGGGTKATISGLTQGTYTITVTDKNHCSVVIKPDLTCAPVELLKADTGSGPPQCCPDNVNLYPNPNTGQFTLSGLEQGMTIEMYDYTGRKISSQLSTLNPQLSINISSQPNGIYLIRILDKTGNLISQKKVMKMGE